MYEAEAFSLFKISADFSSQKNWAQRLEFYNQCFSRHQLDPHSMPTHKRGVDRVHHMMQSWAAKKHASIIGQKCPNHHVRLQKLADVFPNAEFIIIWRNPLDCCNSTVKASAESKFFNQPGILTRTLFGCRKMADGVTRLRKAGHRVHELCYEDLITNTENEMRRICNFIEVSYAPSMLDLSQADRSMLPKGRHHDKVRSDAIHPIRSQPDALSPKFIAKTRRYSTLWRSQYADLHFARVLPQDSPLRPPGWHERIWDRAAYAYWQAKDGLKRVILCHIPLPVWQRWRRFRQCKKALQPTAK